MHNEHEHNDNPGYETSDVKGKQVFWSLFILAVVTIFCVVISIFLFKALQSDMPEMAAVLPSQVTDGQRVLPPAPRLQAEPPKELKEFRSNEDEVLTTYGWVDKSKQKVRIPVDRALDIIAERGLPFHKAGDPLPVVVPAPPAQPTAAGASQSALPASAQLPPSSATPKQ